MKTLVPPDGLRICVSLEKFGLVPDTFKALHLRATLSEDFLSLPRRSLPLNLSSIHNHKQCLLKCHSLKIHLRSPKRLQIWEGIMSTHNFLREFEIFVETAEKPLELNDEEIRLLHGAVYLFIELNYPARDDISREAVMMMLLKQKLLKESLRRVKRKAPHQSEKGVEMLHKP